MSDVAPLQRQKNMPIIDILVPQGENRYIARVHENQEYVSKGGIVVANTNQLQDIPTTGDVLRITDNFFDKEKFPDVRPGMCVKVTFNGWTTFKIDGELYAIGSAQNVIAAYDPKEICQE